MNKLRTGDEVIVISGKDKGKTGTLTKIKGDRCLVSGIKLVKKHVKPKKEKPPRVQCPFKTAKGSQCRKYCMDGAETCKVHSKPLKAKKVTKILRKGCAC